MRPGFTDISSRFNSRIGTDPGCLTGRGWYYGIDNNHGNDIDLVTGMAHYSGVPVSLVVRTALDPVSLVPAVQAAVGAVDPSLPLRNPQALATFLSDSVAPERFRAAVLGVIGALGLTLAALGIYAVTYRSVVERTHEFAVRMALGSGRGDLLRLVLGDAVRDVMIGEMCPDAAADRPAVLPLYVQAIGWKHDEADVALPLERNSARQFSVLGWDGRRVGRPCDIRAPAHPRRVGAPFGAGSHAAAAGAPARRGWLGHPPSTASCAPCHTTGRRGPDRGIGTAASAC